MVSLGDTAISLHILQLNSKCQDLLKFQFSGGGGGVLSVSKLKVPQELPKFQFFWGGGGGWGWGCSVPVKTQSAKICLHFNFQGGGCSVLVKTQSAKIRPTFHFRGGGGVFCPRTRCSCQFEQTFLPCHATFWKPLHHRSSLTYYICGD